jgi:predicted nucleic acid-binding protein
VGLTVLDKGVLIAVLDGSDVHHQGASSALRREIASGNRLVVPASAYAELLVGPSGRGASATATATVDAFLDALPATVEPVSRAAARIAAGLRARRRGRPGCSGVRRGLRLPDALVIGTAIALDADLVLTTDRGWPTRLGVPVDVVGARPTGTR